MFFLRLASERSTPGKENNTSEFQVILTGREIFNYITLTLKFYLDYSKRLPEDSNDVTQTRGELY